MASQSREKDFLHETEQEIACIENALSKQKDLPSGDELEPVIGSVHTIKVGFAVMGLIGLRDYTHALEGFLDDIKNGYIAMSPAVRDLVRSAAHTIRQSLKKPDGDSDLAEKTDALNKQRLDLIPADRRDAVIKNMAVKTIDDIAIIEIPPNLMELHVDYLNEFIESLRDNGIVRFVLNFRSADYFSTKAAGMMANFLAKKKSPETKYVSCHMPPDAKKEFETGGIVVCGDLRQAVGII